MKEISTYKNPKSIFILLGVAVTYFVFARLGLMFEFGKSNSTPIWIPSGIALAALFLYGIKSWPAISLGAFAVNIFVFLQNNAASPVIALWVSILIAAGNTLEAVIGYKLLKKLLKDEAIFENAKNSFSFFIVAVVACITSSAIGPAAVALSRIASWNSYASVWFTWWLGDLAGILVFFPLILVFLKPFQLNYYDGKEVPKKFRIESAALFLLCILSSLIVFFNLFEKDFLFLRSYVTIPILLIAAFRLTQREIILLIVSVAAITLFGTIHQLGPFSSEEINYSLLAAQIFVCIMAATILSVKAALNQLSRSEKWLKKTHEDLELLVKERTDKLKESYKEIDTYHQRLEKILDTMLKTSILDFSGRAPISEKGDDLDAIAVGLNIMSEELQAHIRQIKESEEKFSSVVENIKDYAIYLLDANGNIITWNQGAENIKGYYPKEIIGKHFSVFFNEEDKINNEPQKILKQAEVNGRFESEGWRVKKDGTKFWADAITTALYSSKGELTGFAKITRDMTYKMATEKQLRDQKELYQTILNTQSDLGEGMSITEGVKFVYANDALCKMYGYTREELLALPSMMDLIAPKEKQILLRRQEARKQGKSSSDSYHETSIIRKDGKIIHIGYSRKEIFPGGKEQTLAIIRDITLQKEAEQKILESEEKFSKAFQASPAGISISEIETGKIIDVNESLATILGYSSNELIGKTGAELKIILPEERAKLAEAMKDPATMQNQEFTFTKKSGKKGTALLSIQPIILGSKPFLLTILYDVSLRKELEKTRDRLNIIIESSPDFVGFADAKTTNILYINKAGRKMCGIGETESLNNYKISDVHPEWTNKLLREKILPAAVQNGLWTGEAAFLNTKTKEEIPVLMSLHSHKDGSENVEIFSTISRDITERKEAEQKIIEREKQISSIIESAPDAVIVINSHSEILRWNKQSEKTFGWQAEEVAGKYLYDLIIPERFREKHKKGLSHFLATGEGPVLNRTIELPALKKDGNELEMELTISPTKVKDEFLFVSFLRDISARKKVEEKIKESEEKFNKAFTASPAGILITRLADQKYVEVNDAIINMTGYSRQEFIGHSSMEMGFIIEPRSREKMLEEMKKTGSIKNAEMNVKTKDGKIIHVLNSIETIQLRGEKHALNVVYDITELKQSEEKINTLNRELQQTVEQLRIVNKELESFSYSVSHDLRAPLRAIHGYTKILSDDYAPKLDEDAKSMMRAIMVNSKKMGQLIDDLLNFSRLGRQEIRKEKINMNELVRGAILEINKNMPNKAKFTVHELGNLETDYSLMHQVIYNIISNAVKYSSKKENPVIEIGSHNEDGHEIFYVKDNGAGFDMKYYNKLFGVFQRLHTQDEFEGTGVGLAIVQRIVNKMGGKVWAEGKVNEGASFYFTLNIK